MKKFLALLLSVAMMLIPMSALAADATVDIDYNANKITISGKFDNEFAGRIATLVIVNPEKNVEDFDDITADVLAWADQGIIGNKGDIEFVVDMTSAKTGAGYQAYIAVNGTDDVIEGTFNYTEASEAVALLEEFSDLTAAADVKEFMNRAVVINTAQIEAEIEAVKAYAESDAACEGKIFAGVVEYGATDYVGLKTALNEAIKAYEMSIDEAAFDAEFSKWIKEDAATYKLYNALSSKDSDNEKAAVKETIKDADPFSKVAFMAAYRDAVLTETVNNAKNVTAINTFIVTTAKDEIPEDIFEKYDDIKDKKAVQKELFDAKPFENVADFIAKLDDACDDQADAEAKKSDKGSSGGKGGSTTISVDPQIIAPKPAVVTNPFADVADNFWAKDAILELYKKDIVAGQGANTFAPDATITRAEFVQMVVKAFGFGMKGDAPKFDDVTNEWFANAVAVAYTNGVVRGTTEKTFAPTNNITRQDLMVILTNAATAAGKSLTAGDATFADANEIAAYATDAVAKMTGSGIVYGSDGFVKPLANATRAEAAAMLARILAK